MLRTVLIVITPGMYAKFVFDGLFNRIRTVCLVYTGPLRMARSCRPSKMASSYRALRTESRFRFLKTVLKDGEQVQGLEDGEQVQVLEDGEQVQELDGHQDGPGWEEQGRCSLPGG